MIWITIGIIIYVLLFLLIYSLCHISAKADEDLQLSLMQDESSDCDTTEKILMTDLSESDAFQSTGTGKSSI